MKKLLILSVLGVMTFSLHAQQRADFRAAERFAPENLRSKVGSMSVRPNWIHETDYFWYSFSTPQGKQYYYVDARRRDRRFMFDRRYMAAQMQLLTNQNYNLLDLPLRNIEFEEDSHTKFTFNADSIKFLYDIETRNLVITDTIRRTRPERRPNWPSYSPDSTWIVFGRGHDLYMMRADDTDSLEIRLTTDGEAFYSYTNASSRTEPDTTRRVRARGSWFRNSEKYYMTRSDQRKVQDLWVIDVLNDPRPSLQTYRYAMPGEEHVGQSELIIWDVETKERIDVELEKWHNQFNSVRWVSREGPNRMIVTRKCRTYQHVDVLSVDANTGEIKVLIEETIRPYISGERLHILNDGQDLIWRSERTGWQQYYLYDGEGNLKNQITDDFFVAGNIQRIDTAARTIILNGYGREPNVHPYYSMMYKASIDRQGLELLTPEAANHSISISRTNNYFVNTYSTVDKAPVSVLKDMDGSVLMQLEQVDLTELYRTGWREAETFVVKASDGVTDLFGVMYKPHDFDSTRKYPVISYVYPGPQTESVPYGFTVGGNFSSLAQLGFIVVNFGHRGGSPMRDQYYHSYGYQNLRDYALEDDKYGLMQLADRHDFIDITRVGIYGHSGGGFMSTAAILTYPEFYRVAVSSAGNHDNNIYNRNWSESNHGVREIRRTVKVEDEETGEEREEVRITYESNPAPNQELAENLRGYLLLVHGEIDSNVHPGNTSRVVDALISANKRFDMLMVPGMRHGFGGTTRYFQRMMWYYFSEHLLGDYRTNVDMYEYRHHDYDPDR